MRARWYLVGSFTIISTSSLRHKSFNKHILVSKSTASKTKPKQNKQTKQTKNKNKKTNKQEKNPTLIIYHHLSVIIYSWSIRTEELHHRWCFIPWNMKTSINFKNFLLVLQLFPFIRCQHQENPSKPKYFTKDKKKKKKREK